MKSKHETEGSQKSPENHPNGSDHTDEQNILELIKIRSKQLEAKAIFDLVSQYDFEIPKAITLEDRVSRYRNKLMKELLQSQLEQEQSNLNELKNN